MKRLGLLCVLLALLATRARAVPPSFTGCMVNYVSDRSAQILCFLSAAGGNHNFRVLFGYDKTLDRATGIQGRGTAGSVTRNERITSLPPNTDVFFSPLTTDSDGATWSSQRICSVTCDPCGPGNDPFFLNAGAGHSRISCTAGEPMRFRTLPLTVCEGGPPCRPTGPIHNGLTTPPAVTGSSRTVAPGCTNLQALIKDAATHARAAGTVEEILIPPGEEVCRPENEVSPPLRQYSLPSACPGKVLIHSGADPRLLPPPGTAIDPSYLPHTGKFGWNRNNLADLPLSLFQFNTGSGCYYFSTVSIQPPPPSDIQPAFVTAAAPTLGRIWGKIDDGKNVTDATFDRVLIQRPYPWRSAAGISLRCDRCAYVNSWDQSERWRLPGSNMPNEPYYSVYFHGSRDFQIVNNTFYMHPFLMIDNSSRGAENITIAKNILWNPDFTIYHPGNPDSNGLHYRHTFCMELKSCKNCRITGNYYKGCRADFNRNGPAFALAGSGDVSQMPLADVQVADVEFAYNTIDRSGGGFMVAANDNGASRRRVPTERIWGHDNLIVGINKKYVQDCCAGGQGLYAWDSVVDLIWERNTYHVESAPRPFATECTGRGQGHRNRNNIYVATRGSFQATGFAQVLGGSRVPQPSAMFGSAAFQECYVSGANPDPLSSFDSNVIIPGIEASASGSFSLKAASRNTADTWCVHEAIGNPQLKDFSGLRFVGSTANPCNESFNERLDAAFEPGTWRPKSAFAGNGADLDALEGEQEWIENIVVTADSPTQVTIDWLGPTASSCWAQITRTTFSDPDKMSDWTQAIAGSKSQSVPFSGLTPGKQYAYRVSCGRPAELGLFTTASE